MGQGEGDYLIAAFPRLADTQHRITSPQDLSYNCIAWAASDNERWWWPSRQAYWPPGARLDVSVEAFVEAYASIGYARCGHGDHEDGFEKVALYAIDGRVQHAARQVRPGVWMSKLGEAHDIEHELEGVVGSTYGVVAAFLRRQLALPP